MLKIDNLTVKVQDKVILDKLDLEINKGEIHVLMGPNGTGKSTICKVLLKHPDYEVINGTIFYKEKNLEKLDTTAISRMGMFLLAQTPVEIEGITNAELIRNVISEKTNERVDIFKFNKKLNEVCEILDIPKEFVHRDVNFNMSGGEKKKNELLQLFMLEPDFIILDEIDSGLDVDAIKTVGEALNKYYEMYKPAMLIVTHHAPIMKYFKDFKVHVLRDGKIVQTGDDSLVKKIELTGFKANVISGNEKDE